MVYAVTDGQDSVSGDGLFGWLMLMLDIRGD
jgi:hypothetical protein